MALKPGDNSGKDGGIYQEQGPRGGKKDIHVAMDISKVFHVTVEDLFEFTDEQ